MNIVEFINSLEDADTLGELDEKKVESAEKELGIKFAEDYRNYLLNFSYLSFEGVELTGIVDNSAFNVVDITKKEREENNLDFKYYVISELGIDSILILQDEDGFIYEREFRKEPKKIFNNLIDYLKSNL